MRALLLFAILLFAVPVATAGATTCRGTGVPSVVVAAYVLACAPTDPADPSYSAEVGVYVLRSLEPDGQIGYCLHYDLHRVTVQGDAGAPSATTSTGPYEGSCFP
jgi:hypothetical protein